MFSRDLRQLLACFCLIGLSACSTLPNQSDATAAPEDKATETNADGKNAGVLVVATSLSPKPEEAHEPPKSLRDAVWQPFVGFLSRPLALEILGFVVFYKLSDVMANALLRPFLIDMGYNADDRGFAIATVGLFATLFGTLFGGTITTSMGLGHALWVFGFLQTFAGIWATSWWRGSPSTSDHVHRWG